MKSLFTSLLCLSMIAASCQKKPEFAKVETSEIDQEKLAFVTQLADDILVAQKEGGFYALKETEASEQMVSGLNENVQKESYDRIKTAVGDYQDLQFDHLMRSKGEPMYEIYRYVGTFDSQATKIEIRAVLNSKGKLAGFFVKPWKDQL